MSLHCDQSQVNPHRTNSLTCLTLIPSTVPEQPPIFSFCPCSKLGHSLRKLSIKARESKAKSEIGGQENMKWKLKLSLQNRSGVELWPGLGIGGAGEVQGQTSNPQEKGKSCKVRGAHMRSELANTDEEVDPRTPDPDSNSSKSSGPLN